MGEEGARRRNIMKSDHKMTAAARCSCGDGRGMEGRGLSKRHNKIIYVVRNADGVRGRRGRMPMRASEGQFMPVENKH